MPETSTDIPTSTPVSKAEAPGERLINRELSWLDFNDRVLAIAADEQVPLLERVRFCSIFSSNLDEFFMVRVAGLMGRALSNASPSPDGMTAAETLSEIRSRALLMYKSQTQLWKNELQPRLSEAGVFLGGIDDCTSDELQDLEAAYRDEL